MRSYGKPWMKICVRIHCEPGLRKHFHVGNQVKSLPRTRNSFGHDFTCIAMESTKNLAVGPGLATLALPGLLKP
jgi:hypothetical protein